MRSKDFRGKAIQELLKTEESYIKQLDTLQKYFVEPCTQLALLPPSIHAKVFGELPALQALNKELYEKLVLPLGLTVESQIHQKDDNNKFNSSDQNKPYSEWHTSNFLQINVGEAFLEIAPFFKVYASYASNYQQNLITIEEQENLSSKFQSFLRNTESRPEIQCKLVSLLIVPIQRLPRYTLLLTEILRHLPHGHPHKNDLERSVSVVASAAQRVDDCIGEGQHMHQLLALQKALANEKPKIITPGRKLLKTGLLHKANRSDNKSVPRLFFLFTDILMYTKVPSKPKHLNSEQLMYDMSSIDKYRPGCLVCCCVLPLRHCTVVPLFSQDDNTSVFRVTCSNEDLTLYSKMSKADGKSWISTLRAAITVAVTNRKTLKKDSSAKRPLRRPAIRKGLDHIESCDELPQLQVSSPRGCLSPIVGSPSLSNCSTIDSSSHPSQNGNSSPMPPLLKYLKAPQMWWGSNSSVDSSASSSTKENRRCDSMNAASSKSYMENPAKNKRWGTFGGLTSHENKHLTTLISSPSTRESTSSKLSSCRPKLRSILKSKKRPHETPITEVKTQSQNKENNTITSPIKIRVLDASPCKPGYVRTKVNLSPYKSKWETGEINISTPEKIDPNSLSNTIKPKVINNYIPTNKPVLLHHSSMRPISFFPGKNLPSINGHSNARPVYNSDKLIIHNSSNNIISVEDDNPDEQKYATISKRKRNLRRRSRSLSSFKNIPSSEELHSRSPPAPSLSSSFISPPQFRYNTRSKNPSNLTKFQLNEITDNRIFSSKIKSLSRSAENLDDSPKELWRRDKLWTPNKLLSYFPKKKSS